jgi:hypothetical protein
MQRQARLADAALLVGERNDHGPPLHSGGQSDCDT